MPKPLPLISPNHWPARRPDGQTAGVESDPAPPVKGSSVRPGVEKITVRVPTQKARKFKLYCALNGLEQRNVIEELLDHLFASMSGRPDGQTALNQISDDLMCDDEARFLTSSSSQSLKGRPDGQENLDAKRRDVLAYYVRLTGNPVKQNDHDALDSVIDLSTYAIKCGIGKSMILCKSRVNSFRYCLGAIEEIAESGVTETYLAYMESVLVREGKWKPETEFTPASPPLRQATLPGASNAGDLLELKRKEPE